MIDRASLGFKCGNNNYDQLGKNSYKFVKYEDLVKGTKNTMEEISDFLEIEFKNTLLKPTFCGLDWPGNRFSGEPQQGVNSDGIGSWEQRITESEAVLLEFFFDDYMKEFNYSTKFNRRDSMKAASSYYKWLNFKSNRQGDHSLATKSKI